MNASAQFNISKWAATLRLYRLAPNHQPFLINCYDQGLAVQLGLVLGAQTEDQLSKIRLHFLFPYGFIKPTNLVGWDGPCNNPFVQNDEKLNGRLLFLDDPNDRRRWAFRKHVYASYDNKVLDATCGPALGTDEMEAYLDNAIDRETTLYGSDRYHLLFTGKGCPVGGTPSKVVTGQGLNDLLGYDQDKVEQATTTYLHDFLTRNDLPSTFSVDDPYHKKVSVEGLSFDTLNEELEHTKLGQDVLVIHHTSHRLHTNFAQLSWTMKAGTRHVDLDIYVCKTPELADATWKAHVKDGDIPPVYALTPATEEKQGPRHVVTKQASGSSYRRVSLLPCCCEIAS